MESVALKNKLIRIINASDDRFLEMVNALHQSYVADPEDFYDELPTEIRELLAASSAQMQRGEVRPHNEVMADFRKKYGIQDMT